MNIDLRSIVQLRAPGLGAQWLGRERYIVRAGGVLALPVMRGDELEVVDPEGLQRVQVFAFNALGENAVSQLGMIAATESDAMQKILHSDNPAAKKIQDKIRSYGIDLKTEKVAEVLSDNTIAGASVKMTGEQALICLIGVPGEPMSVEGQNPPTDITVYVDRANPGELLANDLPDPLADEKQSIRIDASTARSYEIKAGEYIQVIDVDGRQCSDFQCFDLAKLDAGLERCLDATTTRALMGVAYPGPGLFSKFYDVDFEPVLEVVQDTCGRHDSFGLACTSKYYDEVGYPGHVNCSENFNQVLSDYPIVPRKGWMAMNLFFNTFFDDDHQFMFDDPWSRPGDYVLLKALKDMVCVSSSCPCDIDPANGWVPTDIHIRTYTKEKLFKRAIAFRKTPESEPEMTKETAFHSRTAALTRDFTEYSGYWLANSFTNHGAVAEYWACREKVIVTDLSPLRKYEVTGPDAERLLQSCVTRDIRKLGNGHVVYTAMCYESGGMIDDGTVFRLGKDNFRWVGGTDDSGLWLRKQAAEQSLRAWVKDSTSQLCNLQVQGPKSKATLQNVIWTRPDQASLEELAWFRFSIARIGDAKGAPIVLSRTGYTGEMGYEIFCHPNDAESVWNAIWEAGQAHGIVPLGLEALDLLRIEAGLIFAGYEFCDQTDPFEAGIGFTVPLKSKQDDFIGREALVRRKAHPQQKLVGLEVTGNEPGGNGDHVFIGKEQVGVITSGMISPTLGKNIALARLKVDYCALATEVEIGKLDGHQKRLAARVVPFPHFDPGKERVRGNYG